MLGIVNSAPQRVFSFLRERDGDRVFAVFNFSAEPQEVTFAEGPHHGNYRDFASGGEVAVDAATRMRLPAWGYRLLTVERPRPEGGR